MAALGQRLAVLEGGHFYAEQQAALTKRLTQLVESGLLPQSALPASNPAESVVQKVNGLPTIVKRGRPQGEYVYNHVKSLFPMQQPSMMSKFTLGTGVSFGRARWNSDGANIFSVADGKRLAQTPIKEPTAYERIRAERIARAELQTPLVRGMRLLPVFSPGRAFFWGSVLALWGTAGVFLSAKKGLGIQGPEDANEVLASIISPYAAAAKAAAAPVRDALRQRLALPSAEGGTAPPVFVQRLREKLYIH